MRNVLIPWAADSYSHLAVHDADFRTSEKDFDSFAAALTEKLIEHDETIPELPVKDIV